MYFFVPLLWYQRVDLGFNFTTETTTAGTNVREIAASKIRGYEFWKEKLSDGLLVSRTVLANSVNLYKENGVYKIDKFGKTYTNVLDYLATRKRFIPTFADPGTWTYSNHLKLPDELYDTEDLINYYNQLQYDMAGSADWPIVDKITTSVYGGRKGLVLTDKMKEERLNITLENAKEFIKYCNRRDDLNFVPFGTCQGYSVDTYVKSVKKVLKMGYKYIAIGGLPAYSEQQVLELLPPIWKEVKKADVIPGIHLYGRFPSPAALPVFLKNGITSFDNNWSHIAAITNIRCYFDPEFRYKGESPIHLSYGLKIPPLTGPFMNRLKKRNFEYWKKCKYESEETFKVFLKWVETGKKKDRVTFLARYERMERVQNKARQKPRSENGLAEMYDLAVQSVEKKGWERCGCTSCRICGPHITMQRTQRCYHMFLHNTYVMYDRLLRELKRVKKTVNYNGYDWSTVLDLNAIKNKRQAIRRKRNG